MARKRRVAVWLVMAVLGLLIPAATAAQDGSAGRPEIGGSVVDAETMLPLEGTAVRIEGVGVTRVERAMVTGPAGVYRFEDLPVGRYRIALDRLGYYPRTIEVDLGGQASTVVSVGMELRPVALPAVQVIGAIPQPYLRVPMLETRAPRAAAPDVLMAGRHLVSDARELTQTQVFEAVTLAEADLFRALQRVPGVGTRDDYTATMWTRGAPWDQTRVYFDGLPLYNPTHAGWLFAAINPDAVGAASFHPGYRSAEWGEGSAAVLDLRSRSGSGSGAIGGNAEISLASARLALHGERAGARPNWLVAVRRSYVDLLPSLLAGVIDEEDLNVPYDFSDLTARVDGEIGSGWRYEASGILERDHLRGEIPGLLRGNRGRWGNRAGRLTVEAPVGRWTARVTAGATNFSTFIVEEEAGGGGSGATGVTLPTLENGITHRQLDVQFGPPAGADGARPWAIGLQTVRDSVTYEGTYSLLGALISGGTQDPLIHRPYDYGSALAYSTVWGERRFRIGSRLAGQAGLRVEFGDSVFNGGRMRPAPRLALRAGPFARTFVTGGWSRSFQYIQDIAPAAGPIGPQLHLSAIWVLASPAPVFPAVRADLFTLGLEHAPTADWLLVANVYHRDASGLKIPNPEAGPVVAERATDAEAENGATGFELMARRMGPRWTASLGYAYGVSELRLTPRETEAGMPRFPSSADIRHGVDATAMVRVGRGVQAGGAFTFGSGVPFTRLLLPTESDERPMLGEPNAARTPSYASLDLVAEYTLPVASVDLSGYVQVRNVTNRDNSVTYSGSWECGATVTASAAADGTCVGAAGVRDRFERGLPRLALVGFRVEF